MRFPVQTAGACRLGTFCIITALLFFPAGDLALARAGVAAPAERGTARQLVRSLDAVLADAAQAAGSSDPRLTSFQSALARMRLRVSLIDNALARRDEELFVLLDQGSSDLGWMRVAWARAGVKNDQVTAGLRAVSASYRFLRAHYGREGLRHRQGAPLSEAERRQFERVKRAQRRFADSLQPLREQAQRRNDPATVAELDRFRAEAERLAWAPLDLEVYLNALIAAGEMRGEWEADAPYIRADAPEELTAAADDAVQDLYVESDIGHVFTVDLAAAGGWPSLDGETDVPAGEEIAARPAAVQVYAPAAPADGETEPVEATAAVSPDDIGEGEPAEGAAAESLADPEGLEEAAAELTDDEGILEEEDAPLAEASAEEEAHAGETAGETAAPAADSSAVKAGSAPASTEVPPMATEPPRPEPAKPPAVLPPPVASPIG